MVRRSVVLSSRRGVPPNKNGHANRNARTTSAGSSSTTSRLQIPDPKFRMSMKRICVFCGSRPGRRPEYRAAAEVLGRELAQRNIGLVYGGGNVGLMGIIADSVLQAGGEAIGVIPENLMALEVGHTGLTKLHVVRSM